MKKANEYLDVFDRKGNFLGEQKRDEFYEESRKEFKDKGRVSKQVKTIRLLLLNKDGRIYLQKRSKLKGDNPGLYDKTVGGHVYRGHSFDVTVTKECAEELGFPAAVLPEKDFNRAIKNTDLSVVGLFRELGVDNGYESLRVHDDGSVYVQPHITAYYIGYYNGPIRFVDGEASGIEVFSLDELEAEIKVNPMKFTTDLRYMIERFKKYLKPVRSKRVK